MTDQHYGLSQQGYPIDRRPQSHLVNVRTNSRWHKQVNNRVARGNLFWPSDPIEVVVSEGCYVVRSVAADCAWWDRTQSPDDTQTHLQQSSKALPDTIVSPMDLPPLNHRPSSTRSFHHVSMHPWTGALKVLIVALFLIAFVVFCSLRMGNQWRHRHRTYSSIINNRLFSNARFSRLPIKPVS